MYWGRVETPSPFFMDIEIICNTDDETLFEQVAINSRQNSKWVKEVPAHDGHAVLIGGGPSLTENLHQVFKRYDLGQTIFALNGSARFLNAHGIAPHYQVILDARPENIGLLADAQKHLLSSQCHPSLFACVKNVEIWHPAIENLEAHLPEHKDEYALIGGGTTIGLSAMCLAYTLGYRKLHLFGYDSSHKNTLGHAYHQPMNDRDVLVKVTVEGQVYTSSLTMARQAELFPTVCNNLNDLGCVITCNSSGLINAVIKQMNTKMTEAEKYEKMWGKDIYRRTAPGELIADLAIETCNISNESTVIDFGCGTGRGGKAIKEKTGAHVTLVDFANNCRDSEDLPFVLADLTQFMDLSADVGYCTDVMEHIPTKDVPAVIINIMECVDSAFFQISLVPDNLGALIGQPLHLSVYPVEWWLDKFKAYEVVWSESNAENAMFYVKHTEY